MKTFQIIHLRSSSNSQKQALMDTLLIHNITCFGIGPHIVVIDDKPEGHRLIQKISPVVKLPDVKKVMQKCGAQLLTFDDRAFEAFKKYLSKEYVFKKQTGTSLSYKSKTQPASFTIYQNGRIKTSKDLLDIALMANLVRIMYGESPVNPQV